MIHTDKIIGPGGSVAAAVLFTSNPGRGDFRFDVHSDGSVSPLMIVDLLTETIAGIKQSPAYLEAVFDSIHTDPA